MIALAGDRPVPREIATINAMGAVEEIADVVGAVVTMRPQTHPLVTRSRPPMPNKHVPGNRIVVAEANHAMNALPAPRFWK